MIVERCSDPRTCQAEEGCDQPVAFLVTYGNQETLYLCDKHKAAFVESHGDAESTEAQEHTHDKKKKPK